MAWWKRASLGRGWGSLIIATASICLGSLGTYGATKFSESKLGTRIALKYRIEPIPTVNLTNVPYVANPVALDKIKQGFEDPFGGILVLYAPPGSGKTTYLASLAMEYKNNGRHVEFIHCAASKKHLYDCLGITNTSFNLSEVIPDKSVVILDQMESVVFGDELKAMLRDIALDSRKIKNYIVLVSVSSPEIAEAILNLNGNDKIRALGEAREFKWSRELISKYVEMSKQYISWNEEDKAQLIELATRTGAPAFLFYLEGLKAPTPLILTDKKILIKADKYASEWENATIDD